MVNEQTVRVRPDEDIEESITDLIRSYPPLRTSRAFFTFASSQGAVKFMGNVRTPQARFLLAERVPHIAGVRSVDVSELYDDEQVRFAVGKVLPPGVYATVHYGAVALTGRLPEGMSVESLLEQVRAVAGVRLAHAELSSPQPQAAAG
ncbi:MAG: BON domain-containing protein [Chloroflexi bacterium]|nr:BON domain-containing protein [Chloroflexota bacterium]